MNLAALRGSGFQSLAPDLDAAYLPELLEHEQAQALLAELYADVPWRQEAIEMFGRRMPVPRLLAWVADCGRCYAYSGLEHAPVPWPPRLLALRRRLEALLAAAFPGVLVNRYRSGRDCVGWHADDERSLGNEPLIASVSLGAERRFAFRRRTPNGWRRLTLVPAHGSLLVMWGRSQRDWQHALPRTRRDVAERINLTFRQLDTSAAAADPC